MTDTGLKRIAHVILRVRDLDAALAFYRDKLGLEVAAETEGFAFLQGGGALLALNKIAPEHAGAKGALTEIVFEAKDVFETWETLRSRGVEFLCEPRHVSSDATHDLYAAPFHDPDDHVLSITGRVEREVDRS